MNTSGTNSLSTTSLTLCNVLSQTTSANWHACHLHAVECKLPLQEPMSTTTKPFWESANAQTTATSLTGYTLQSQRSVGTELAMNSCLKRGNNAQDLALALSCTRNGCKQSDQPLSNPQQCPVPHGIFSCAA